MALRNYGISRAHTGENDWVLTACNYDGGGPLVLVCHGAGGTPSTYFPLAQHADLALLAETGCVVVVADLGGTSTWGNDTFLARIDELRTYAAASPLSADLTRMVLIGDSMGAMGAFGYHWRHPADVMCTVGRIPVVAADALHDRDPAGLGALIDAAYGGGAAWDADKANRDPSAAGPAALISAFRDDVRLWYSTNDPTVLPADITAFTAATGVRAIPLGPIGHDQTALGAAVNAYDQARWIWSRLSA